MTTQPSLYCSPAHRLHWAGPLTSVLSWATVICISLGHRHLHWAVPPTSALGWATCICIGLGHMHQHWGGPPTWALSWATGICIGLGHPLWAVPAHRLHWAGPPASAWASAHRYFQQMLKAHTVIHQM